MTYITPDPAVLIQYYARSFCFDIREPDPNFKYMYRFQLSLALCEQSPFCGNVAGDTYLNVDLQAMCVLRHTVM